MSQESKTIGTSAALFGVVAMVMTRMHRQASSSEDLGNTSFDSEHQNLERWVQSVPKVELHVHLDGAFDPQLLWSHLQKHPELIQCFPVEQVMPWAPTEPPLPLRQMVNNCDSAIQFRHLCTCRRRYQNLRHTFYKPKPRQQNPLLQRNKPRQGTLEDMLICFQFLFPLVFDNMELIEQLAYDFVYRQFEQNVIFTEVRYSPHFLAKDPELALAAVTRGLRRGCHEIQAKYPHPRNMIVVNQILCAISFSPDWAKDVVTLAQKYQHDFPCAVVGVDIAAGEDHFQKDSPLWKEHYDMCQKAQQLGLNITIHAGETPDSARNVQTAIEEYGAMRIGHAYRIVNHKDVMDLVRDKKVHIECCPTSSVETGGWQKTEWKDHPGNLFRDYGIALSLSSDDPAVFNTSLTWQYRIAMIKMGWNRDDIMAMLEQAIQAAFLDDKGKEVLRQTIRDWVVFDNVHFDDRVHYD